MGGMRGLCFCHGFDCCSVLGARCWVLGARHAGGCGCGCWTPQRNSRRVEGARAHRAAGGGWGYRECARSSARLSKCEMSVMMPLSRLGCREMEGNRSAKSSRPGGFGRMTRAQCACTPAPRSLQFLQLLPMWSAPWSGVRAAPSDLPAVCPAVYYLRDAGCITGPLFSLLRSLTMLLLLPLLPLLLPLLPPLLHRAFCLSSALSRTGTRIRASGQPRPAIPNARTLAHSPSSHIRDRLTAHGSICAPVLRVPAPCPIASIYTS
jgi:hypothetical protein